MSKRIGEVHSTRPGEPIAVHVLVSRAGVELHSDPQATVNPTEARNYAALLVRGADEVERIRAHTADPLPPPSPRIGVAVLAQDPEGRLLLGQRGKEPNYGKWVIPGGGIQLGEDWRHAGERELHEETGLIIEIDRMAHPFVLQIIEEDDHRVVLFAPGAIKGGVLRPASDLLDARFVSREEITRTDLSTATATFLSELGWG